MSQALSASKEISFAQGYAMLRKEGIDPKAPQTMESDEKAKLSVALIAVDEAV